MSLSTAKLSKCEICKARDADGLLGRICRVCQTKIQFEGLPPEQQEKLICGVVPKLFMKARMTDISKKLRSDIDAVPQDRGLLLWGRAGVGKSHIMAALARGFVSEGYKVERIAYEMLCLKIRDTYKPTAKDTELSIIAPLITADKLFIEDIGATVSVGRQESDFSLRTFLVLLDQRLEACMPIYITTNKPLEELKKSFDERIASRLQQSCEIIRLDGPDRRKSVTS